MNEKQWSDLYQAIYDKVVATQESEDSKEIAVAVLDTVIIAIQEYDRIKSNP